MTRPALLVCLAALALAAPPASAQTVRVVTDDLDRFWQAFDAVEATPDSLERLALVERLYLAPGTPGLDAMIERRGYTAADYVQAIARYPEFWASVRRNTAHARAAATGIRAGVDGLRVLYPDLRPATVYFTVGALMTNGMTLGSTVFIGSELALADSTTPTHELPERLGQSLRRYFATNPAERLPFLSVHEAVHTQQGPFGATLLAVSLQEGVAEFLAALATGEPSPTPAVAFMAANEARVLGRFSTEMFSPNTDDWLYNDTDNAFGVRDLGYAVGYTIARALVDRGDDRQAAVRHLIELDYQDPAAVEELVDASGVFDRPLATLHAAYDASRPALAGIAEFQNGARDVDPAVTRLTLTFSEPMSPRFRNFEVGPLGADHVLRIQEVVGWSDDGRALTARVQLEPGRRYQLVLGSQFRTPAGAELAPTLIDVSTRPE